MVGSEPARDRDAVPLGHRTVRGAGPRGDRRGHRDDGAGGHGVHRRLPAGPGSPVRPRGPHRANSAAGACRAEHTGDSGISRTLAARERYRRPSEQPLAPVTILDKPDVLDGLFAVWENIDTLVSGFDAAQWQAPTALPGWTVHDVVAHLIGTESMLQGAGTPDADIDVSTLKHVRNDIGVLNERWVRQLRDLSAAELLEKFRATTAERRMALSDMSDRRVEPDHRDAGRTRHVRTVHAGAGLRLLDARARHPRRGRAARGRSASSSVRPPTLALDEMAASMGFVVGKLGGAPDGSRVAIELTGPLGRTINVAVDGRGGWWTTSATTSPRRRSDWTACCSPGWRAAGPRRATTRRHRLRRRRGGRAGGSSST